MQVNAIWLVFTECLYKCKFVQFCLCFQNALQMQMSAIQFVFTECHFKCKWVQSGLVLDHLYVHKMICFAFSVSCNQNNIKLLWILLKYVYTCIFVLLLFFCDFFSGSGWGCTWNYNIVIYSFFARIYLQLLLFSKNNFIIIYLNISIQ